MPSTTVKNDGKEKSGWVNGLGIRIAGLYQYVTFGIIRFGFHFTDKLTGLGGKETYPRSPS